MRRHGTAGTTGLVSASTAAFIIIVITCCGVLQRWRRLHLRVIAVTPIPHHCIASLKAEAPHRNPHRCEKATHSHAVWGALPYLSASTKPRCRNDRVTRLFTLSTTSCSPRHTHM